MKEKNLVLIKSFKNGLRLILDKDAVFSEIIAELSQKCRDGKNFFGNSNTAISIEGRTVTEEEEIQIIESINNNCDLNVICIVGKDESDNESSYFKAIELMQSRLSQGNDSNLCTYYRGNLTDGDSIETVNPVVVLGDVNPGCKIISAESIIVLGGMYGEAVIRDNLAEEIKSEIDGNDFSGINKAEISVSKSKIVEKDISDSNVNNLENEIFGEKKTNKVHFVLALDLSPERIEINDSFYRPDIKPKWGLKHKIVPRIAFKKDDAIVLEDVSKSVLEMVYAL